MSRNGTITHGFKKRPWVQSLWQRKLLTLPRVLHVDIQLWHSASHDADYCSVEFRRGGWLLINTIILRIENAGELAQLMSIPNDVRQILWTGENNAMVSRLHATVLPWARDRHGVPDIATVTVHCHYVNTRDEPPLHGIANMSGVKMQLGYLPVTRKRKPRRDKADALEPAPFVWPEL